MAVLFLSVHYAFNDVDTRQRLERFLCLYKACCIMDVDI